MTRILPILLAASLFFGSLPGEDLQPVLQWIAAVRTHRPGAIDAALLATASQPPAVFAQVLRRLRTVLAADFPSEEDANDIVRRAMLLHSDIAILLPRQAAAFTPDMLAGRNLYARAFGKAGVQEVVPTESVAVSVDGEFRSEFVETAHWWVARRLAKQIRPQPSRDAFVCRWYRAISARFQKWYLLGPAKYHLDEGLKLLPDDPVLLFYAGAMHEAFAAARYQSIPATMPEIASRLELPSPVAGWHRAQRLLRASVERNGPDEARVRLARVLGHLGQHAEAAGLLRSVGPRLDEPRLQYLCALFLGSEEQALGRLEPARQAFERAARLFPTAQAPLIALADLASRAGDAAACLAALSRLTALPPEPAQRDDPWSAYHRSYALDAEQQLLDVREFVDRREPR